MGINLPPKPGKYHNNIQIWWTKKWAYNTKISNLPHKALISNPNLMLIKNCAMFPSRIFQKLWLFNPIQAKMQSMTSGISYMRNCIHSKRQKQKYWSRIRITNRYSYFKGFSFSMPWPNNQLSFQFLKKGRKGSKGSFRLCCKLCCHIQSPKSILSKNMQFTTMSTFSGQRGDTTGLSEK